MDMNWQAMLREAADTSFNRKTARLAAADHEACSCADLSQVKVQELSKKILQLPHQGIVLLFSRYCFRLSPNETEQFFQLQNAKGRFRFYRELLSSGMGLSSEQVISDASLNQASAIALEEYLQSELNGAYAVHGTGKGRTRIMFRRVGNAAAAAAIALTLLFSVTVAANAELREKVISWVVEIFEKYSIFTFQSDDEDTQTDLQSYQPTYLPDRTVLENTIELPEIISYKYEIADSDYFVIQLCQAGTRIYADTEGADIEPLDEDGLTGYLFQKDGLNYVCFERDGCSFTVYGSIDVGELKKIAVGITKK